MKKLTLTSQSQNYAYQPAGLKNMSYEFSLEAISYVKKLNEESSLSIVCENAIKSVTSVGSNIIEAESSRSEKEARKFFEIAYKSVRKSEYWLSLLRDSYRNDTEISSLILQSQTLRSMLDLMLEPVRMKDLKN